MENKGQTTPDIRQIVEQINQGLNEVRQALEQHAQYSHQIQDAERSQRDSLVRLAQAVMQTQTLAQHVQWIEAQRLGSLGVPNLFGFGSPQYQTQFGNPFAPQFGNQPPGFGFNPNFGGGGRRGHRGGRGRGRGRGRHQQEMGGYDTREEREEHRGYGGRGQDNEIARMVKDGIRRGIESAIHTMRESGFEPNVGQPWQQQGYRA